MAKTEMARQLEVDKWYTRPIFTVTDMPRALQHYCGRLGFMQDWKHDENGRTIVTQVNKGECELILEEKSDQARVTAATRVYISLEPEEMQRLEQVVRDKNIPVEHVFWGYDLLQIADPDNNLLLVSAAC